MKKQSKPRIYKSQQRKEPVAGFKLFNNGKLNTNFPYGYNLATGYPDPYNHQGQVFEQNITEIK